MVVSKWIVCFFSLLIATMGYTQNKSTGYEKLDAFYAENGYSIEASDNFVLGENPSSINLKLFGGNTYNIQVYAEGELPTIETKLLNSKRVLCAKSENGIDIDLSCNFGSFEFDFLVSAPKSEMGEKLVYVLAYKSFNNSTNDHTKNRDHSAFHTLDGVDKIDQSKNKIVKELENYLSKTLNDLGCSVSKFLLFDNKNLDKVLPYTFYRDNEYLLLGINKDGSPIEFKVVRPEFRDPFDKEKIVWEEKIISNASNGSIPLSFIQQAKNLWEFGVRLDETKITSIYRMFSIVAIAYKSKDNQTENSALNKEEKAYVD